MKLLDGSLRPASELSQQKYKYIQHANYPYVMYVCMYKMKMYLRSKMGYTFVPILKISPK